MTTSSYPVSAETRLAAWAAREGQASPADTESSELNGRADVEQTSDAESEVAAPVVTTMRPGGEYDRLQQQLVTTTFVVAGIIAIALTVAYSPHVAISYGIGALGGVVYFRMLARGVARLGRANQRLGPSRLVLVAALTVVAIRMDVLEVLPVFLGFLTYKVSLLIYAVQVLSRLAKSKSS
ncbi:MAG: ATP synthase subunit I [Cyanobacteria bacterium P01_F01_bin.33]